MNLCLEFLHDSERSPIELKRSVLLIGRHPECDVRINLKSISRRHCCLAQVNDSMILRDLGSRHGVWVNGQRIEEKVLKAGDQLAIGPMIFKVIALDNDHVQAIGPPGPVKDSEDEFEDFPFDENLDVQAAEVQNLIQDTSSNPERRIGQFWRNLDLEEPSALSHFEEVGSEDTHDESEIGPGLGLKL